MPACSIIIRAFNEERFIGRLLESIQLQTVKNVETILVDSGSTDKTLDVACRYPVKIVSIPPQDFSFGRALNVGLEESTADLAVLASAHVYPLYSDWIERILHHFSDSRVALCYGRQRGNGKTSYAEKRIFSSWYPAASEQDQKTPFCNNANAAIRREVWQRLPYNEDLTGLEDLEWGKKVKEAGYRIVYCAESEVVHVHDEPPLSVFHRYQREAMALKKIYPEERFTLLDFVKLFPGNVINDLTSAWRESVFRKHFREIMLFRLMQFWGTYCGFRRRGKMTSDLRKRLYYPGGVGTGQALQVNAGKKPLCIHETEIKG